MFGYVRVEKAESGVIIGSCGSCSVGNGEGIRKGVSEEFILFSGLREAAGDWDLWPRRRLFKEVVGFEGK